LLVRLDEQDISSFYASKLNNFTGKKLVVSANMALFFALT